MGAEEKGERVIAERLMGQRGLGEGDDDIGKWIRRVRVMLERGMRGGLSNTGRE